MLWPHKNELESELWKILNLSYGKLKKLCSGIGSVNVK